MSTKTETPSHSKSKAPHAEPETTNHSTAKAPHAEPETASVTASATNPLDQAQALVKQVAALVGPAPALTAMQRKRSLKLRKGGETVIPTVAALSEQFGLSVAAYPTATMAAKANQAVNLIPLHKLLVATTKQVSDQMFSANSESWEGATAHYALLRRLSRTNGDLATALAPVKKFFATRSKAVVEAHDAKTGHKEGEKATKQVASAPATEAAPQETPGGAAAAVTPAATPSLPASATPTATHS